MSTGDEPISEAEYREINDKLAQLLNSLSPNSRTFLSGILERGTSSAESGAVPFPALRHLRARSTSRHIHSPIKTSLYAMSISTALVAVLSLPLTYVLTRVRSSIRP